MKRVTAILVLVSAVVGTTSFARPFAQGNRQAQAQQKKGPSVPMADAMDGYYINRIKAGVGLSDDQFDKIAPYLLRMLRESREITLQRNRLMMLLRQSTNTGPLQPKRDATDEELAKLTRDLDQTAADRLASQQAFLKNVDPLLNDRQRARLRVFQDNIERQILNLINSVQNPPQPAANPPAAPAIKNPRFRR